MDFSPIIYIGVINKDLSNNLIFKYIEENENKLQSQDRRI